MKHTTLWLIIFFILISLAIGTRYEMYDYSGSDIREKVNYSLLNANNITQGDIQVCLEDGTNCQKSTTYNASTIQTLEGTLDAGNLTSIQSIDSNYYNVSEDAGVSPLLINITFENVNTFSNILFRLKYTGGQGHEIEILTWNFNESAWESHGDITDQSTITEFVIDVLDASDHISDGEVRLRLDHQQNGIGTHDIGIDYIALQEGFTSLVNADHDSLLGRDETDNHPWALAKTDQRFNNTNCSINASCPLIVYDTELSYTINTDCSANASCGNVTYNEGLSYTINTDCSANGSCFNVTYDDELSYTINTDTNCSASDSCPLIYYKGTNLSIADTISSTINETTILEFKENGDVGIWI